MLGFIKKLDKKSLILSAIIVGVLIIGGVGYYLFSRALADSATSQDVCAGLSSSSWRNCVQNMDSWRKFLANNSNSHFSSTMKSWDSNARRGGLPAGTVTPTDSVSPVPTISPSTSPSNTADPVAETARATNIVETSATLNGQVKSDGGSTVSDVGFWLGTAADCSGGTKYALGAINGSTFTEDVSGLLAGTDYYYNAYVTNAVSTNKGSCSVFKTATVSDSITGCAGATFYQSANYAGSHVCLTPGKYDAVLPIGLVGVTGIGLADNSISSVKLEPGYTATIYRDSDFNGPSYNVTQDLTDLSQVQMERVLTQWYYWNDQISSIKVVKTP